MESGTYDGNFKLILIDHTHIEKVKLQCSKKVQGFGRICQKAQATEEVD
jgi:hypothetical protein